MTYLRHHNSIATKSALNKLIEEKKIIPVKIKSIDKDEYYTKGKILKQLDSRKTDKHIHILSPFDNLVIQRKRLNILFNFDYVIECYVPAPKRKYGYFCMPVLYGDKIIGRIDAKADRVQNAFRVIKFFPENSIKIGSNLKKIFENKIKELARFSGCENVIY